MPYYPRSHKNQCAFLLDDLISAKKRGIEVKVLLEKSNYNERLNRINTQTAQYLKKKGIEVRFDSEETITHSKLIIVDDVAVVGSCNWSSGEVEKFNNSCVAIKDFTVTKYYKNYFNNLWRQGSPF